jgi:hypothetical protein
LAKAKKVHDHEVFVVGKLPNHGLPLHAGVRAETVNQDQGVATLPYLRPVQRVLTDRRTDVMRWPAAVKPRIFGFDGTIDAATHEGGGHNYEP